MKKTYGIPIGFSDHTIGSVASVSAVSLGAERNRKTFYFKS